MKPIRRKLVVFVVIIFLNATNAWATSEELQNTGDTFFSLLSQGKIEEAEKLLSKEWREAVPRDVFLRMIKVHGLDDSQSIRWQTPDIAAASAQLKGKFKSSQDSFNVTLFFAKEENRWLINTLSISPNTPPNNQTAPEVSATFDLVIKTMTDFADAVNAESMDSFYASTSKHFRILHGLDELEKVFSQFYAPDDFRKRVNGDPSLAPPNLDQGVLSIDGQYAVASHLTRFRLQYIAEGAEWKISSFAIQSDPAPQKNN